MKFYMCKDLQRLRKRCNTKHEENDFKSPILVVRTRLKRAGTTVEASEIELYNNQKPPVVPVIDPSNTKEKPNTTLNRPFKEMLHNKGTFGNLQRPSMKPSFNHAPGLKDIEEKSYDQDESNIDGDTEWSESPIGRRKPFDFTLKKKSFEDTDGILQFKIKTIASARKKSKVTVSSEGSEIDSEEDV